ncbi:MAG: hypothetical protein FD177_311 [Desulfovibrionaceae bacterium]|nr:MAG: hypothetical protein FD177_311 [Desulfovibrionaceae bacterium]
MSERGKKVLGIPDYTATLRARRKSTFLDEIYRLIDWKPLAPSEQEADTPV